MAACRDGKVHREAGDLPALVLADFISTPILEDVGAVVVFRDVTHEVRPS